MLKSYIPFLSICIIVCNGWTAFALALYWARNSEEPIISKPIPKLNVDFSIDVPNFDKGKAVLHCSSTVMELVSCDNYPKPWFLFYMHFSIITYLDLRGLLHFPFKIKKQEKVSKSFSVHMQFSVEYKGDLSPLLKFDFIKSLYWPASKKLSKPCSIL